MSRINTKDLEIAVERLNKLTGNKLTPYTKHKDGKFTPNANVYLLDWAYGGVKLSQMCEEGTGQKDVLSSGFVSKPILYNMIHAYIKGVEEAQTTKKRGRK